VWRTRIPYGVEQVRHLGETTIAYYDRFARAFWNGTQHHDVSQNYAAFLNAVESDPPYSVLDLGCGPGRDLSHFRSLGHEALGLDGSQQFVAMARAYSGCEVLHQDFLSMRLPDSRFDGIFANASLFHVPSQELPRVLLELRKTLKPRGVLFSSNPRGNNEEGWSDGRYEVPPRSAGAFFAAGLAAAAQSTGLVGVGARMPLERRAPGRGVRVEIGEYRGVSGSRGGSFSGS
jgi:SAM-dependent methyltransferase